MHSDWPVLKEAEPETASSAEERLVEAVRELAQLVGVDNVRVAAHNVPFTAFSRARAISVLHHDADAHLPERSWLSGHVKLHGFHFDMHSVELPMEALAAIADKPEDEPLS